MKNSLAMEQGNQQETLNPSNTHMMTSSRPDSCAVNIPPVLVLLCLALFTAGCSTPTKPEPGFTDNEKIEGNATSIGASKDVVWASVLEVMAQRGWLIQQANPQTGLITASREIRDEEKKELSHAYTATVTIVPTSEQVTQVIAAASKTTELHKKSTKWWKLLWIIPIFPKGTEYQTVVVNRETVHSAQLYQDFFAAVKKSCEEKKLKAAPMASP